MVVQASFIGHFVFLYDFTMFSMIAQEHTTKKQKYTNKFKTVYSIIPYIRTNLEEGQGMSKLTSKERISRMFEHKEADRIPIWDSPWRGTVNRWHREGMPDNMDYTDYFDLDKIAFIDVDITPRYECKTIEETENYIIYTTSWGATLKSFKAEDSTPDFLDFTITAPDKWLEAKKRMVPSSDRIDWNYLESNYKKWVEEGQWIVANFWFGFDVTHSWTVGTERFLMALVEDSDWCVDMFNCFIINI